MTHPTWELPIADNQASLVLTPCPGTKGTPLPESIAQLKAQGVSAVVTALSHEEMEQHGVGELPAEVEKPDYSGFMRRSKMIARRMRPLRKIGSIAHPLCIRHSAAVKSRFALHGRFGSYWLTGRASAAGKGWPLESIITQVQALRPGAFTKVQVQYVHQIVKP